MLNILNALKSIARRPLRFGLIAAVSLFLQPLSAECAWEKKSLPSAEAPVDLAQKSNTIFVATAHQVFAQNNSGWKTIFRISDASDSLLRLHASDQNKLLWIQTAQSIYGLDPSGKRSVKIYSSRDPAKAPLAFFAGKKNLYLGTRTGLWQSSDEGKSWQKHSARTDHDPVTLIAETETGLFFSSNGYFQIQENDYPQTVLKLFDFEDAAESEVSENSSEETADGSVKTFFFDFLETEESFYLATLKGVYQSRNGFDWHALSSSGLRSTAVARLAWNAEKKTILAVTDSGIYRYDSDAERWLSFSEGLIRFDRTALTSDSETKKLLAVTPEGLWEWSEKISSSPIPEDQALLFNRLIRLEPSAREIHRKVIAYSDTSNAKITRWHAASRLAALAPSFSLGKDFSNSNNIDVDRGSTSDPDRFIEGPREKDRGVDLDLSWDLGDFIFSSSQTSIDSREKLMVDLRNDLLAEATRLYYERRRLQAEAVYSPAPDASAHLDRLLRIDELTSLIDALTDGHLSKQVERIYKQNPEFEALWQFTNQEPGAKGA